MKFPEAKLADLRWLPEQALCGEHDAEYEDGCLRCITLRRRALRVSWWRRMFGREVNET